MRHETQIGLLDRLMELRQAGRNQDMLDAVMEVPVEKYTAPEIFEAEVRSIFGGFPMLAGHSSSVSEPGRYLLSDWNRLPFVVVRDKEGVLRAFLNICRHRGARLVSGEEDQLSAFVCPYHGWVYGLDGSLKTVTRSYAFPDIDKCNYGLLELPVAERHGLVWVHPDPEGAMDMDAHLGPFGQDMHYFGIEDFTRYTKTTVTKEANWKLLIKTYLEGYHVPYLHRTTLAANFRKGVLAHDEHGAHMRLAAARTNILEAMEHERSSWNILDYASVYYLLFPNAFFIMHPDYVSINTFYPEAPDRTVWSHEMLYRQEAFPGEKGEKALRKRFEFTNDLVFDQEDFAIAEDIQRGLCFGPNKYHTLGLEEGLVGMFQQTIDHQLQAS